MLSLIVNQKADPVAFVSPHMAADVRQAPADYPVVTTPSLVGHNLSIYPSFEAEEPDPSILLEVDSPTIYTETVRDGNVTTQDVYDVSNSIQLVYATHYPEFTKRVEDTLEYNRTVSLRASVHVGRNPQEPKPGVTQTNRRLPCALLMSTSRTLPYSDKMATNMATQQKMVPLLFQTRAAMDPELKNSLLKESGEYVIDYSRLNALAQVTHSNYMDFDVADRQYVDRVTDENNNVLPVGKSEISTAEGTASRKVYLTSGVSSEVTIQKSVVRAVINK